MSFPIPVLPLAITKQGGRVAKGAKCGSMMALSQFKGAYGLPRMLREIRARGFPASKERVERLTCKSGIRARYKRRWRTTTNSRQSLPIAPDRLAPNQFMTADMTYIWTYEGWLNLAIVLDLFNREVVGWSIRPRMTVDIVTDAVAIARFRRKPTSGLIHHSDRGSILARPSRPSCRNTAWSAR